jgi:hypothetical protein
MKKMFHFCLEGLERFVESTVSIFLNKTRLIESSI